jgi:hypothetical protein
MKNILIKNLVINDKLGFIISGSIGMILVGGRKNKIIKFLYYYIVKSVVKII